MKSQAHNNEIWSRKWWHFATCLTVCLFSLGLSGASAEISISPLRQVISPEAPTAVYEISNPSGRIIDVKISWIDLSATENGYKRAPADARQAISAAPYLTLSPASLRLEPGARGKIAVKLRNDRMVPAGERRSHLLVETDAARTALRKTSGGLEADVGIGISTPVILRSGKSKSAAAFGKTKLVRNAEGLLEIETTLETSGPHSSFGEVQVEFTQIGKIEPQVLSRLDNLAVYTDHPSRKVNAPLNLQFLPKGTMTLRYLGAGEYQGREFSSKTFQIEAAD